MPIGGRYLADITRALSVLGLLLFVVLPGASPDFAANYSQVGASPAVAASIFKADFSSLCGGGWGDEASHAPCHACRADLPMVPPAPCIAEPAFRISTPIVYAVARQAENTSALIFIPPARGPPRA